MKFLRVWFLGYVSPRRLVETLAESPAPQWGFFAQLLRGLMDALLLFLPLALMGRTPSTPSYLTFLPTEQYYAALAVSAPFL